MIFIEDSLESIFKKYPQLKEKFFEENYKIDLTKAKPFITKSIIGIILNSKDPSSTRVTTFRKKEDSISFIENYL